MCGYQFDKVAIAQWERVTGAGPTSSSPQGDTTNGIGKPDIIIIYYNIISNYICVLKGDFTKVLLHD